MGFFAGFGRFEARIDDQVKNVGGPDPAGLALKTGWPRRWRWREWSGVGAHYAWRQVTIIGRPSFGRVLKA
jgi:hypothetical protein